MSFLTWAALAVAGLVIAPLIAHLLRRPPPEEQVFAATTLVPSNPAVAQRRTALEDRALFAIRALAVVLLAILGATPFVKCSRLSLARGAVEGSGTLQWRGAGSALAPVSPLGDYELRFKGDGAAARASLRTLRGPLQVDGQGTWAGGRNLTFRGTARVPPQHRQKLAPLLRLIAIERGDGVFALQLN